MNAVVQPLNEHDIARAIRNGSLTSPQVYHNLLLIALRITGTGAVYRQGLDEYAWRNPSVYLTPEFLERCQGLPVILDHPTQNILNGEQFRERIVGTVMLPYVLGDEVWGICKIYDEVVAEMLVTRQLSTSPSVVLSGMNDKRTTLDSGKPLLIEGKPVLIDHLAICARGTWDHGGPPRGVKADSTVSVEKELTRLKSLLAEMQRRVPACMHDPATAAVVISDGARYQELCQLSGEAYAAPPGLLSGETLLEFRARLANRFKSQSRDYQNSDLYSLADSAAMNMVVTSIYNDAEKALKAPTGPLRMVTRVNEWGHRETAFYGDPAWAWARFMGGSIRVGRINRHPEK